MVEENTVVADDFATIEKMLDGIRAESHYTWIIFENGLCPEKENSELTCRYFWSQTRLITRV